MLQVMSMIEVADNTGVRYIRMMNVLGFTNNLTAKVGDTITASVKKIIPGCEFKVGTVVKAVVIRTRHPIRRPDGSYIRFDTNAAVILDKTGEPKGARVFGPVPRELRERHMKIVSLASEVV